MLIKTTDGGIVDIKNEFICQNIECDYYENGYCWGYAWPVENVKECDEWDMWKEVNQDDEN